MFWLLKLINPIGAITKEIARTRITLAKEANAERRIEMEERIGMLAIERDAHMEVMKLRREMAARLEIRLVIFIIGMTFAIHILRVGLVSTFPEYFPGVVVNKFPAPMDEWEAKIVLGLFGLGAAPLLASVVRRR